MRHDIEAARLILEKISYLDGRENIGACRADLIEAHRLLGDALETGALCRVNAPFDSIRYKPAELLTALRALRGTFNGGQLSTALAMADAALSKHSQP